MSLIISANGGLGNRLRPLLSAISITNHLKHYVIKVLWCKNITCDTYYNTLFTNENISIIEIDEVCALKPHIGFIDYNELKSYQDILKKDGNNSGVFNVKDKQAIDNLLCNNKNIFIDENNFISSSFVNSHLYPQIFYSILKKDIRDNILNIIHTLQLDKSVIGSHLRGTDVLDRNRVNSISNKILNNNNNQNYFICSDMEELECKFQSCKHIIMHNKNAFVKTTHAEKNVVPGWNFLRDEDSVIDALTDICCLSFCNITNNDYHSYPESTFLEIAKIINGWENIIIPN
jgi:hypothetical protein